MPGVLFNAACVIVGGLIGTLCGSRIPKKLTDAIISCIAFITMIIGVQSAIGTSDIMIVMICLSLGTVVGVALKLDDRMNGAADHIKERLATTPFGKGRFAEGFVTTSLLFCIGAMAVVGSIQAGLEHDYKILYAKSAIDFISAIVYSAALGPGVLFSAVTVLVVQGAIALLAGVVSPLLSPQVVTEMSAVGGAMFIGMGLNLLNAVPEHVKIGDMLPGIFMPIIYFPIAALIAKLL